MIENDFPELVFQFEKALNCKGAYEIIKDLDKNTRTIDVAIIDMSLPQYIEKGIFSGVEVGLLLRKHQPRAKIIIATAFTEIAITKIVMEKLQPDALVCKSDIKPDFFVTIFKHLDAGKMYFGETIKSILKNDLSKNLKLDTYDLKILQYLHKGFLTKDLPSYIGLSLSAIEKRKASLKVLLFGKKCSDKLLIEKVKELGIV